jgi:hypothetical protein
VRIRLSKPRILIQPDRHGAARFAVALAIMFFLLAAFSLSESRGDGALRKTQQQAQQKPSESVKAEHEISGHVGSRVCAQCHGLIANKYSRTDMGRSMSEMTATLLEKIPSSASIVDDRLQKHFDLYAEGGKLFQSEYAQGPDDKEIFRETHEVDWIIGSGANGFGALLKRGDFIFEAPLSFYSKTQSWSLSPGYEFGDYGFNRPILPGCIACHSGMPRAVPGGSGRFLEPPFYELAIGCENCHGAGAAHVHEMQEGDSSTGTNSLMHSIVNPAKLQPWLADNICMSCHQTGDAMVLRPGKEYRDFKPGTPLDDTLAIFMVPPRRDSPQTDLLEHYFSMTLSKCYRSSGGRLSCITCHDPHVEPAKQEAPVQFRAKCLQCHNEKSCALPVAVRQRKTPPNDCAGCHMPKREVQTIAHAVLTNHRIVAQAEDPYPDAAFHMTSPQTPDLVHVTAIPGKHGEEISPLLLLQAYGQLMIPNPEYRGRYFALAKQLQSSNPNNIEVLEALAALALDEKDDDKAIRYFDSAVKNGSKSPQTYEQLASLLVRTRRFPEAVNTLEPGIKLLPFDALLYRLLGVSYLTLNKNEAARRLLQPAVQTFPQDRALRQLLKDSGEKTTPNQ